MYALQIQSLSKNKCISNTMMNCGLLTVQAFHDWLHNMIHDLNLLQTSPGTKKNNSSIYSRNLEANDPEFLEILNK